jgi:RNA polymerase sigma-70 factor, ECF subfamily
MNALATSTGFTDAYEAYAARAFAAAYRVLGEAAAAEDVVQDVFFTIWRNPAKFDPARGSLPGYVAMMARSRAVDRVRSRQARDSAIERLGRREERDSFDESPADAVLRRDEGARALGAVAELPPAQREAVLLAYGRGFSAAEMAEASGVPLGTAKSRLRLGLQKARESLTDAEPRASADEPPALDAERTAADAERLASAA